MLRNSVVMILGILGVLIAAVSHAEESICAVVKIEIRQEMTIERQGFEAQMKIINKLDTLPMNNIQVEVYFQDESGQPVLASSDPNNTTAQFFIRVSSVDGLRSSVGGAVTVEGNSYLPASGTGDIRWLIIPAQHSGGGTPEGRLYQVGATLKFSLGGENNELSVTPDTIRVRPMPLLKLDYFITREVRADDPTTSVKEPIEPFTLSLIHI